jgi:hypothetical protein
MAGDGHLLTSQHSIEDSWQGGSRLTDRHRGHVAAVTINLLLLTVP